VVPAPGEPTCIPSAAGLGRHRTLAISRCSVFELVKTVDPLTDPTAHGGRAEAAFDVVIPSMPGYGFSSRPQGTGWNPDHIASAWAELMRRLGYKRYVAQGGDWPAH
jgi:pimeloyl-ACP methyl ester carboxylesterase